MVASRFKLAEIRLPVARALDFTPAMFLAADQSAMLLAPFLFLMPKLKIAKSVIFTAMPCKFNSLMQFTASVSIPLIAPFEKGVLCDDMCSANLSRS